MLHEILYHYMYIFMYLYLHINVSSLKRGQVIRVDAEFGTIKQNKQLQISDKNNCAFLCSGFHHFQITAV